MIFFCISDTESDVESDTEMMDIPEVGDTELSTIDPGQKQRVMPSGRPAPNNGTVTWHTHDFYYFFIVFLSFLLLLIALNGLDLSAAQMALQARQKLLEAKEEIARISMAVLEDSQSNVSWIALVLHEDRIGILYSFFFFFVFDCYVYVTNWFQIGEIKKLYNYAADTEGDVKIRKMAIISLLSIYKDILPG